MKRGKKSPVDLHHLAGQFSDALAFVECALMALSEDERVCPAVLVLEYGLEILRRVHRDLDDASAQRSHKSSRLRRPARRGAARAP